MEGEEQATLTSVSVVCRGVGAHWGQGSTPGWRKLPSGGWLWGRANLASVQMLFKRGEEGRLLPLSPSASETQMVSYRFIELV